MTTFTIKKILVPTDFSDTAGYALKQAIGVAKKSKAIIKLLHVVTPYLSNLQSSVELNETFYYQLSSWAKEALQKTAREVQEQVISEVEQVVRFGSVSDEICSLVQEEKIDLIIMGTHGTSGIKEFFAGSNAYSVVKQAACPVLTIRKKISPGFKKNLLPIRLERSSRQKVDYAIAIARLFNATLLVTGFTAEKNKASRFKVKQYVAQVERYLTEQHISYTSQCIFEPNFIKEMLVSARLSKADLVVIMSDHDFSLDQLLKGPYAEQFVNHATVPMLSVPVSYNTGLFYYSASLSGAMPG